MTSLVLCVEDHIDDRLLSRFILEDLGCTSIGVSDGEAAIEMLRECQPDLILLDICLPGIDGFELIHQLKLNPATAEIPVIAVTALAMMSDRILAAGFDGYIPKPFAIEEFESTVRYHLARSAAVRVAS